MDSWKWAWEGIASYPCGKADIVHQRKDAGREEVAAGKDCLQGKNELYETLTCSPLPLIERRVLVSSFSSEKEKLSTN